MTATHHLNWFRVTSDSSKTYVRKLSLHDNALRGTIPAQIGQLTSLTNFGLQKNALSGTIPTQIGQLTSLTDLYLHNNALSGAIPTQIQDLTSLTTFYLFKNTLSGSIPNGVCDLPASLRADCVNCEIPKTGCCNDCYEIVSGLIDQTLSNVIGPCAIHLSCTSITMDSASSWFKDPDNHPDDLTTNKQVWKVSSSRI